MFHSVVGKIMAPKDIQLPVYGTVNMLPSKGNLQESDLVKDFEMERLSWIIQVSPIYYKDLKQGRGRQKS